MEYTIARAVRLIDIESLVSDLMKAGWVPHGSLVVHESMGSWAYFQPMLKKKK